MDGSYGWYWSSELITSYPTAGWEHMIIFNDTCGTGNNSRCFGLSVRPVAIVKDTSTAVWSAGQKAGTGAMKCLEGGRIIIRRDDRTYNTAGQRVGR